MDEFGEMAEFALCIANETATILHPKLCTEITITNSITDNEDSIYTAQFGSCTTYQHPKLSGKKLHDL
jgi:hypothetical protein